MTLAALVLAAGASRRLGQPKQLLVHQGRPLVLHAVEMARGVVSDAIVVVTGSQARAVEACLAPTQVTIARHDGWEDGQGSSIACGTRRARAEYPATSALLVMTCDQIWVPIEHLRALGQTVLERGHAIAASGYDGRTGVPACFGAACFDALETLRGPGARAIVRDPAWPAVDLACPEAAWDVDTPADLDRLEP